MDPIHLKMMNLLFKIQDEHTLYYSPGNHCNKFYRFAKGNQVQLTHGLETTVAELDALPKEKRKQFLNEYRSFYEALPLYQSLDEGNLIIAHAGIREDMIGLPLFGKNQNICSLWRYLRVKSYLMADLLDVIGPSITKGLPYIVYGHTPVTEARFVNNTVNVDTGCVFGGKLTALRYPEMEIVSVPSLATIHSRKIHSF